MKKIFTAIVAVFVFTVSSFAASRAEVMAWMNNAKNYNYFMMLYLYFI